jgi:hypothetical protein
VRPAQCRLFKWQTATRKGGFACDDHFDAGNVLDLSSARGPNACRGSGSDSRLAGGRDGGVGCGLKDGLRDLATTVAQPFGRAPTVPVDAPDANLANNPVVAATKSIGLGTSCLRRLPGKHSDEPVREGGCFGSECTSIWRT